MLNLILYAKRLADKLSLRNKKLIINSYFTRDFYIGQGCALTEVKTNLINDFLDATGEAFGDLEF